MKPSGGSSLEDGPFGVHPPLPVPEPPARPPYDKEEEDSAVKSGEEPPTRGNTHNTVPYAGCNAIRRTASYRLCVFVWFDPSSTPLVATVL